MENEFSREELLIGTEAIEKLKNSKVAIFGIGGVGSYVLEALARAGVQNFVLVDNDKISITNINRQIIATHKTLGKDKVEVAKDRVLDINPEAKIEIYKEFFTVESEAKYLNSSVSYIADCIDTVSSKIELIERANKLNIPIISSMGTGNKVDATKFEITDIYKTSVCPLAKVIRKELRKRNIKNLEVIYSKEEPIKILKNEENIKGKQVPGSISYVPSVAGLMLAERIIKKLID